MAPPDLTERPHNFTIERLMRAQPADLYDAWTQWFELWLAARGSVSMLPEVNAPFFFETQHAGIRHAHYGRFLELEHDRLIELTWVTTHTLGAETVVTVSLVPHGEGTLLRLRHAGFPTAQTASRQAEVWPGILEQLDARLSENAQP
nr:SRPBCC domain-containing protein [Leifsonia psychrotolerans]